ncbi:MAG: efflux RND transporter periplasmic adaptor subunit [Steroidobacteraceae bacterium]
MMKPTFPLASTSIAATLAAASILVLSGCGSGTANAPAEATRVRSAKAYLGPAAPPIESNGAIVNRDEMKLSFKVAGILSRFEYDEGASVRKGAPLAQIELTEINAQVTQARALADKAARDLARGERLYADQVIALDQLEALRTQQTVARAQLKAAQFNRGYAVITAPDDGIVLRKLIEERELVQPGAPVLLFGARTRGYVVKAALADRDVLQLKIGDPAEVRIDAYHDRALPGTVSEIAGAADPASGLFNVEVTVDAAPVRLASGLVATLRIYPATSRERQLVYVPIAAVVEGVGRRASVFVVDGDHARRKDVDVGFFTNDAVALRDGLPANTAVVTEGALFLDDGEKIEIVDVVAPAQSEAQIPLSGERS